MGTETGKASHRSLSLTTTCVIKSMIGWQPQDQTTSTFHSLNFLRSLRLSALHVTNVQTFVRSFYQRVQGNSTIFLTQNSHVIVPKTLNEVTRSSSCHSVFHRQPSPEHVSPSSFGKMSPLQYVLNAFLSTKLRHF